MKYAIVIGLCLFLAACAPNYYPTTYIDSVSGSGSGGIQNGSDFVLDQGNISELNINKLLDVSSVAITNISGVTYLNYNVTGTPQRVCMSRGRHSSNADLYVGQAILGDKTSAFGTYVGILLPKTSAIISISMSYRVYPYTSGSIYTISCQESYGPSGWQKKIQMNISAGAGNYDYYEEYNRNDIGVLSAGKGFMCSSDLAGGSYTINNVLVCVNYVEVET